METIPLKKVNTGEVSGFSNIVFPSTLPVCSLLNVRE